MSKEEDLRYEGVVMLVDLPTLVARQRRHLFVLMLLVL
jgi:hypothetical protein